MVKYKRAKSYGESLKKAGITEYRFTRDWSFYKKGSRRFLSPRAKLTKNLTKKGIIVKIKHR